LFEHHAGQNQLHSVVNASSIQRLHTALSGAVLAVIVLLPL